jgi:hypothetical protein
MLIIPLTRTTTDPLYEAAFHLNVDLALSFTRALDDTHTRIRSTSVYTQVSGEPQIVETLVVETPEQIAALIEATRASGRRMLGRQVTRTRTIGSPTTSPARPS